MLETDVTAEHVECSGIGCAISFNAAPKAAQGVVCQMFVCDTFYFRSEKGEIGTALYFVTETFFSSYFQCCDLW